MSLNKLKVVLGSGSPRRKQLMEAVGFVLEVRSPDIDEEAVTYENARLLPEVLAKMKNEKILSEGNIQDCFVVTADTIVLLDGKVIGKPKDKDEAKSMLISLSKRRHEVITGVCISYNYSKVVFSDSTMVLFNCLEEKEIDYYLEFSNVLDKAGSYGIQDWIGLVGVRSLEGSFYNVMGLPVDKVYHSIIHWNT